MRRLFDCRHWPEEGLDAHVLTVGAAVAGAGLIGGLMSSNSQRSAANTAANAQTQASQAGIDEQRREFGINQQFTQQGIDERQKQFAAVQQLLAPYASAGPGALSAQQDLTGANGPEAQQKAISALQGTPAFQSQLKVGENRILANASATGGLRGGNTQAALGYFAPQLLSQTINDQYSRLGGLSSLGLNAAGGIGNAGMAEAAGVSGALGTLGSGAMTLGQGVSGLLQQGGSAQAGAALAGGRAQSSMYSSFGGAAGQYFGMGGRFGGFGGPPIPDAVNLGTSTGADASLFWG